MIILTEAQQDELIALVGKQLDEVTNKPMYQIISYTSGIVDDFQRPGKHLNLDALMIEALTEQLNSESAHAAASPDRPA
jgi:hypothetical protein